MNKIINENGINFTEILRMLLKNKLLLLMIISTSTAFSIYYSYKKENIWISNSIVTFPTTLELSPMISSTSNLSPIIGVSNKKLLAITSSSNNFKSFITYINSNDNKLLFISQDPILKDLPKNKKMALIKSIFAKETPFSKVNYNIEVSSNTKESAKKILTDYISFTENRVNNYTYKELNSLRAINLNRQSTQLELDLINARSKLLTDIEKSKYAYKIANKANVTSPIQNLDNNYNLFKIGLGSQALKENISILESIKDLTIVNPNIAVLKNNINLLSKTLPAFTYKPFRYIDKPNLPNVKSSPSMIKVIIIGIFIGFIMGLFIVILVEVIKSNKS